MIQHLSFWTKYPSFQKRRLKVSSKAEAKAKGAASSLPCEWREYGLYPSENRLIQTQTGPKWKFLFEDRRTSLVSAWFRRVLSRLLIKLLMVRSMNPFNLVTSKTCLISSTTISEVRPSPFLIRAEWTNNPQSGIWSANEREPSYIKRLPNWLWINSPKEE